MARFYYKVWIDVPDEGLLHPETEFIEDHHFEADWDEETEEPTFPPEVLAGIVMGSRLGCDEEIGFDYTVDYEAIG
jgi:hypothetical protein